jgi:tetratricopeptide (TPR) repeat protein
MSVEQALDLARQMQAAGQFKDALALLKAVLDQEPANKDANLLILDLARRMQEAGQFKDALALLKAVVDQDPAKSSKEANLLMGEVLLDSGAESNYDQARLRFKEVLNVESSNFRANLGTGKIWLANGLWRQAVAYLEKAERVASDTQRSEAKRLLAHAYAGAGDLPKALKTADEAVDAAPRDLDALQTRVEIEIRLTVARRDAKQLEKALEGAEVFVPRAEQAVEQAPGDGKALDRLNSAYELALSALRSYHNTFYELDRGQPTDRVRSGSEAQVADILLRVVDIHRRQAALRFTLAEHAATGFLERAVEYQPKSIRCLEALADAYARIKDRVRAIEVYRRIIELDPNHAAARQYLDAADAPAQRELRPPATQPTTATSGTGLGG